MMKQALVIRATALLLTASVLLSGCSSTTMIQSKPEGAKIYLNEELVGTTPYAHSDTRIVGSTTRLRLEKEGYETLNSSFTRNEEVDAGAIVGGIFLMFPYLWTMKYKPSHTYELVPLTEVIKF
jgi:hypothetical protein